MSETTPEKPTEETPSSTQSSETEKLEEKIEQTEEKLEAAKSDPEYATKEDVASLTSLLNEFREELKDSKKTKAVVPPPEKKEDKPTAKVEPKTDQPKEEPKTEEPKETSYGSRRWFGGR